MNLGFTQTRDTLYSSNSYNDKYYKGRTVELRDSLLVGLYNSFVYCKDGKLVTGIVVMGGKSKYKTYCEVVNGVTHRRHGFFKNRIIIEEFTKNHSSMVVYKDNKVHSIHHANIIKGKMYFVDIKIKKGKYKVRQIFFNEKGKLRSQKMTVKNLEILYMLPVLAPIGDQERIN